MPQLQYGLEVNVSQGPRMSDQILITMCRMMIHHYEQCWARFLPLGAGGVLPSIRWRLVSEENV